MSKKKKEDKSARNAKIRKILAVICYVICLTAYGASGYVSWLSFNGDISYKLGFLIFLPVWIVTYWFSTFFVQLLARNRPDGKTKWLMKKTPRKILNGISNVLSVLLLGFWVYVYISQYMIGK